MKLSQMYTGRAVDVLCELSVYLVNILTDEELVETLKKKLEDADAKTRAELLVFGAEKISAMIPIILKKHKDDVFGALAVLNETTAGDIAGQNILVTMEQVKEAVQDKDFVDFFKSCVSGEKK